MQNKIRRLFKSKFLKHVTTLASGTAVAQLLGFAFIPILSRTYPQEAFGLLTSYATLTNLVSSYNTLKYSTAVVLVEDDRSAYALLKLSTIIALILTTLSCLILFLPIPYFQEYKGLQLYIAFGAFLLVSNGNSELWNIRFKQFKITSFSKVIQAVAIFSFKMLLYKFFKLKGLIIGTVMGVLISAIYLIAYRRFDWSIYRGITINEMKAQALRYIDFPKYFTLSNIVLSLSANLPVLMFVKYISLTQLGIYGMSVRIISKPIGLIAESFTKVTLSYMTDRKNNNQPILKWYLKMILLLFIISVFGSIMVMLIGTQIVELFLGPRWVEVGSYIKVLIPMLVGRMIASPGITAVRVFEMQKYTLIYSIFSLTVKALTLSLLFYYNVDFVYLLLVYSIVSLLLVLGNNGFIVKKILSYEQSLA